MTLFDVLTVFFVLFSLVVLAYCKMKDKTLFDVYNEIKLMIVGVPEEVVQGGIIQQ